jgi:2-amino-4-hydroxy-6-hydroxymethyldihydropteridine diphosphokinase
MTRAFLGLGTNLGDRRGELLRAVTTLEKTGELVGVSNLYETEPVGGPPQDPFLNIVVALETTQTPEELLVTCQALETTAERVRTVRFGPRTLDVDVLYVEGETRDSASLTVPHPRMFERAFVLAPLRELAPDLVTDALIETSVGDVVCVGKLVDG